MGRDDIAVRNDISNYVIELKIKYNQDSLAACGNQILIYMDCLLANEGWLVIFDRKSAKNWKEKIIWETVAMEKGVIIHAAGC